MNLHDPTSAELAEWEEWCDSRPSPIAEVARRLPPWKLYRLKSTGQRVTIAAYDEPLDEETGEPSGNPVTLKVDVDGRFNFVIFDRRVFGVAPDNLEECDDLPDKGEPIGTILTEDADIDDFVEAARRDQI